VVVVQGAGSDPLYSQPGPSHPTGPDGAVVVAAGTLVVVVVLVVATVVAVGAAVVDVDGSIVTGGVSGVQTRQNLGGGLSGSSPTMYTWSPTRTHTTSPG